MVKGEYKPGEVYGINNGEGEPCFAVVQRRYGDSYGGNYGKVDFRLYSIVNRKLVYIETKKNVDRDKISVLDEHQYEKIQSLLNKQMNISEAGRAMVLAVGRKRFSRVDVLRAEGKLEELSRGI